MHPKWASDVLCLSSTITCFGFWHPRLAGSRWHISLRCTSDWLRQSSAAEKSYVHHIGSTKEVAASSSLPLRDLCLLSTQEEVHREAGHGPSRPSPEVGVWPYRGRRVVDEEAGLLRASWMFSRHPCRSILESTRLTTSSVASLRGVRRRQASSMLYWASRRQRPFCSSSRSISCSLSPMSRMNSFQRVGGTPSTTAYSVTGSAAGDKDHVPPAAALTFAPSTLPNSLQEQCPPARTQLTVRTLRVGGVFPFLNRGGDWHGVE